MTEDRAAFPAAPTGREPPEDLQSCMRMTLGHDWAGGQPKLFRHNGPEALFLGPTYTLVPAHYTYYIPQHRHVDAHAHILPVYFLKASKSLAIHSYMPYPLIQHESIMPVL